jgi:hypothetical protein
MVSLALTLLLAGAPLLGESPAPPDEAEPWAWEGDEPEEPPRLDLTAWGGQAWSERGSGFRGTTWGGEATWRFDALDLGLFGGAYELPEEVAGGEVETYLAPVYLLRLGQRFETRNGLLASFTFGVGAAKAPDWRSWFQVALGVRMPLGPAFLAGELAFESEDVLRLALGVGVSVF